MPSLPRENTCSGRILLPQLLEYPRGMLAEDAPRTIPRTKCGPTTDQGRTVPPANKRNPLLVQGISVARPEGLEPPTS